MVSIEYSPNARARCQRCRDKIVKGAIRVCAKSGAPVSRNSGYTNQYHHAECYTNRKDFTSLWGFRNLSKEDQKRFMTEAQKRQHFPADYAANSSSGSGGLEKRDANVAKCTEEKTATKKQKKDKEDVTTKKTNERGQDVFAITGLKYAEATAVRGEKVTLLREPENQYDSNAVKVINGYRQLIGRIEKTKAAILSPKMKQLQDASTLNNSNYLRRGLL